MAAGLAKLQLLIDFKQKLNAGLNNAKKQVAKATGQMQTRLDNLKMHHVKTFKAMEDHIPGLRGAMELLRNPFVLLAASIMAVGVAFAQVSNKAMDFEHNFTNIRNLNLQKPRSELNKYRSEIAKTAIHTGINLDKMTTGYYDLQSALGVFGKDATKIATLVGNYSIATQSDFTDSINSTTKAMKAFGIGADGVQALLESNAKTVQTGIVTFAELAKVQTEYAGAASAAGQNVDVANKIFAAFTSIASNAAQGANMAKTAFQGFTDPKVLSALEKQGITIYDEHNNMLDLLDVIKNTSTEIDKMSGRQFNQFMGDVGGPEGLKALFGKLRTSADDFFATMENFDNTKFDLNKALAIAGKDPFLLKQLAAERWSTLMAQIGVGVLPLLTRAFNFLNNVIIGLSNAFEWLSSKGDYLKGIFGTLAIGLSILHGWTILAAVKMGLLASWTGIVTAAQWLWNVALSANPLGAIVIGIAAVVAGLIWAYKHFDKFRAIVQGTWAAVKGFGTILKDYVIDRIQGLLSGLGSMAKAIKLLFNKDFSGAWDAAKQGANGIFGVDAKKAAIESSAKLKDVFKNQYTVSLNDSKAKKDAEATDQATDPTIDPTNPEPNSVGAMAQSIGGGSQVKNTTINIDSFIKNFSPTHQSFNSMSKDDMESWMTEMFLRVVRSVEMS